MNSLAFTVRPEIFRAADILVRDFMAVTSRDEFLLTVDTATDAIAASAILASAYAIGCKATMVTIPQLPFQGALANPYVPASLGAAAGACSVWIDLCWPYLAGSRVHDEAIKGKKVRYLLGGDMGAEGMLHLFGQIDLDAWFAAYQIFEATLSQPKGKRIRVTDPLGSDVSFTLAELGSEKPRRAEKPGSYTVPGGCGMYPEIESVKGIIVTAVGFHEHFIPFESPVRLDVEGKIRQVSGAGIERLTLDRALKRAGGGEYGHVIHFTYGMHPCARRTGLSFIEEIRVIGNNAVGTGRRRESPRHHPERTIDMGRRRTRHKGRHR